MKKTSELQKYWIWLKSEIYDHFVFILVLSLIYRIALQVYVIPSGSMMPNLFGGDVTLVSKFHCGARIPSRFALPLVTKTIPGTKIPCYIPWIEWPSLRVPGLYKIKRIFKKKKEIDRGAILEVGDYAVFNAPHEVGEVVTWLGSWILPVNQRTLYIKQLVGGPGDSIVIEKNGDVVVNGTPGVVKGTLQHLYNVRLPKDKGLYALPDTFFDECGVSSTKRDVSGYKVYATEKAVKNMEARGFGLTITRKSEGVSGYKVCIPQLRRPMIKPNDIVHFTPEKVGFYWEFVQYEEAGKKVEIREGKLYIDGKEQTQYTFKKKYKAYSPPDEGFVAPYKGMTIDMNLINWYTYGHIICCHEGHKNVEMKEDGLYINGSLVQEYTFKQNYYFMAGNNRDDSFDSRTWGLVPEDHIEGKAIGILMSGKNPNWYPPLNLLTLNVRWKRFFRPINWC